jgi:N-acetylmuramoyl-L-alanine amidase
LPFGAFDYPIEHASLKGDVKMSGWALSEDGIKEIVVYVDRSFYGFGKMGGPRADVVKVYPAFASTPDIAWTAPLDTTEIPVGSHDVLVRAISNKGAIRDLGNASVNIEH